jgi:hypothetical protein
LKKGCLAVYLQGQKRRTMSNQLSKFKRIFIFDPCFGEMTGHWENYCIRLYDELVGRGCQVKVFGQSSFNPGITRHVNFQPVFVGSPFGDYTSPAHFKQRATQVLNDFKQIDEAEFQDGDLFIFHSIFPHIFAAILDWTQSVLQRKQIVASFFFQLPPSESKGRSKSAIKRLYHYLRSFLPHNLKARKLEWSNHNNIRCYQASAKPLGKLVKAGTHILFASTDLLKRNFSMMLDAPVYYLPMPGPETHYPIAKHNEQGFLQVGYFGHSSFAKGGQFLRYIVEMTLTMHQNVKFVLHINSNDETAKYLDFFKTYDNPNVTCYVGHITPEKMTELMGQVDIILMPYAPIKYATTPSAVFTEGMPLQKVFIIPEKTWVHEEAVKYDAGYVCFTEHNQQNVLDALCKAISNYDYLAQKSLIAGKNFYRENNISNYIDTVENILNKKYITYENAV